MKMDRMNEYLEELGFKVERTYSQRDGYEFRITKDDVIAVDYFKYPGGIGREAVDRIQRDFLDHLVYVWEEIFEKHRGACAHWHTESRYDIHRPKIKKVIFNPPATVVLWKDGTKTVVKAQDEDFDPEKGLAMAISKKALGNQGNYCNEIKKWVEKWTSECEYMRIHKKKRVLFKDLGTPTEFTFTIDPNPANIEALKTLGESSDTFDVCAVVEEINRWREELKPNPVQKAYDILVAFRDKDTCYDLDEVIGYLGEALDE